MPHEGAYDTWCDRLPKTDLETVKRALHRELDRALAADGVITTSWVPGADWRGTPYQPLYAKACGRNPRAAARFYGLLFWEVMLEREEQWGFGRYEDDRGRPIRGLTYFRLDR